MNYNSLLKLVPNWKTTLALGGLVGILQTGCKDEPQFERIEGKFRDYSAVHMIDRRGRMININQGEELINGIPISIYAIDKNNDGRFDIIGLNIPKGHPLEAYASLDSLEEAEKELRETGKKIY